VTIDVLEFHRRTNHSYASVRRRGRGLDWANKPHPFKEYIDLPSTPLPAPRMASPPAGIGRLNLNALAHILHYSAGITRVRELNGDRFYFRAFASAGALYPIEVYVVAGELDGLAAGVYHYHPGKHELGRLREGDLRGHLVWATANDPVVASGLATIVLTGIYWRTMWKYETRGYRHLYWDGGMVLANLLAVTKPMEIVGRVVLGFVDRDVDRLLGLDGRREVSLALAPLGQGPTVEPASSDLSAIDPMVKPLSPREVEYADALAAHDASRLRSRAEVKEWKSKQ
jgi:SagB-type dehydrogenase family enzyme